jgi:hypothetical protein
MGSFQKMMYHVERHKKDGDIPLTYKLHTIEAVTLESASESPSTTPQLALSLRPAAVWRLASLCSLVPPGFHVALELRTNRYLLTTLSRCNPPHIQRASLNDSAPGLFVLCNADVEDTLQSQREPRGRMLYRRKLWVLAWGFRVWRRTYTHVRDGRDGRDCRPLSLFRGFETRSRLSEMS